MTFTAKSYIHNKSNRITEYIHRNINIHSTLSNEWMVSGLQQILILICRLVVVLSKALSNTVLHSFHSYLMFEDRNRQIIKRYSTQAGRRGGEGGV